MIFLSNAAGEITAAIPETINQGSVGVNKIVLIAPFPASSVVSATFTLPNGIKIYPRYVGETPQDNYPYLMGVVEAFGNEGLVIDGVTVNAWQLTLDKAITQIAGKVTVQFLVTGSDGTLTTTSATLPVNRGNAYLAPSVSVDDLNTIAGYLSAAETAEANAEASAEDAKEAEANATSSASAAEAAKSVAESSATAAASSAETATGAALSAETAKGNAEAAAANANAAADRAETAETNAKEAQRKAEAAADRASSWDVVVTQDTIYDYMTSTVPQVASILFFGVNFSDIGSAHQNAGSLPFDPINEKIEFRGCTFNHATKLSYNGSQCSIAGAKGDLIEISGFADVIDCHANIIRDCAYVTACDANEIIDCACVTDTTASTFTECIFVDPFTVNGFVPADDTGKVPTLDPDGGYKPKSLPAGVSLTVDNEYKIVAQLKDEKGNNIGNPSTIDLPLESVVVGATVSDDGTKLILTLQNGNTVDVPIADIFSGLATEEWVNNRVQDASDNLEQKIDNLAQQTSQQVDNLEQKIDTLPPYDVASNVVYLEYSPKYVKLTIDNLLDENYESFQPFDMVCAGSDGLPKSSICTVFVESFDIVRMLVYDSESTAKYEKVWPQYYTNDDGNVYLYFHSDGDYLQVFIRGLVEKCTGATLEIVDALPDTVMDIAIERHVTTAELGDIEAALDRIIQIQESYIGG